MRTILRSAQADEDLVSIWQYIAERNPAAADRLLDSIEHRWTQLVSFPLSGVAREDIAAGIRQLVVGNYLILYRVSEAQRTALARVLVFAVPDGASRLISVLRRRVRRCFESCLPLR